MKSKKIEKEAQETAQQIFQRHAEILSWNVDYQERLRILRILFPDLKIEPKENIKFYKDEKKS